MADDARQPIPLPEMTRNALVELVRQREALDRQINNLDRQINNIVATAQDCLPGARGYVLRDVMVGFEPAGEPEMDGEAGDAPPPTLAG